MIHVLHVIESLEFGGAEKVLVHLANKQSLTHKVSVCLVKRQGDLVNELSDDINVYFLNAKEGNDISVPYKMKNIIQDNGINIIHSHNWGIFIESSIAKLFVGRVKLLHTIHGPYMAYQTGFKSKIKKIIRNKLEKILSMLCFKIVTVSDSIKSYVINDIGISPDKVQTIHNGVAPVKFIPKRLPVNDIIKFISVGRLAKIKNHRLMLDAFKSCLDDTANIELTIVGDGPERKNLELYVSSLGIQQYVNFLGFRSDIIDLLQQHHVFLLSSDYEGISIALLEAMSLSMPAIGTDVGGIPESIKSNESGLIVPKGDVAEYTKAINSYVNEPALISVHGDNALNYFNLEFKEDNVLEQYQVIYNE